MRSDDGYFRIILSGDVSFRDYAQFERTVDCILQNIKDDILVLCGMSRGAETLAELYAMNKEYGLIYYPDDWDLFGDNAKVIRDKEMVHAADAIILFWDGMDRDTMRMINLALENGLRGRVRMYRKERGAL